MKNFKSILFSLFILLLVISCTTENQSISEQDAALKQNNKEIEIINDLLDNIKPELSSKASKMKDFDFITFEVVKNLTTNEISLENFKETSVFPITNAQDYYNTSRESYTISCDNGGDGSDDWSEDCDGIRSCGKLIKKCLDGGGCGTICQNERNSEVKYTSVEVTFVPVKIFN